MEAPRSRRQSPNMSSSLGYAPSSCGRAALLPQTFSNHNNIMSMNTGQEKKPNRTIEVTWVLLLAVAGTLLLSFIILFFLKVHFKQSVAESFDAYGRIKNHGLDRLTKHEQLDLKGVPKSGVGSDISAQDHDSSQRGSKEAEADSSLKGLLADFNEFGQADNCASRGHRSSEYIPTAYLIQRLRKHESLHRKCAGQAKNFFNDILQQGSFEANDRECRYVVWIAYSGLGNRLLSLVSAFLYAMLTDRILLVDKSTDMSKLFCEPFPGTSWLVPPEFSHTWLEGLNESSQQRFGNLFNRSIPSPTFSYVHLTHTYDLDDRMFFCDRGQDYLQPIPWLFMRANNYIVPGLYFLSSFRPQLEKLFSEKEAIFYLLGRYLFHPSNVVWGWIRRYRKAYLANNGKQVGIQIRTFNDTPQAYFQEQLSRCALENKVLPNITDRELEYDGSSIDLQMSNKVTSILVTSLQPEYYEKIRDFYMSASTQDGQLVAVHQPSHEGWQKTDTFGHDLKAWADIYLLSLSDVLITSGWSTFGYAAQALAGVKPWILFRSFDRTVPNPPCRQARSIEPCFHTPPLMDCENLGVPRDPATLLPFVQSCEDIRWGIKLIEAVAAL